MASYYHATKRDQSFDEVLVKLLTTFERDGFVVVSRIDIQNLLSEKLGVDIRRYVAVSVIHPSLVYRAIEAGIGFGSVIPYNIVVREHSESRIEVAAVDPVSIAADENAPEINQLVGQFSKSIEKIILSF